MKAAMLKLPLLIAIGAALVIGISAGLMRLGVVVPGVSVGAVISHGPLMIGGVLGTLISLERVVALSAQSSKSRLAYIAPVLTVLGAVLLIAGTSGSPPKLLITLGSVGLIGIFAALIRRHIALYTVVMMLGAVCWLAGNILWLSGQPVYQVVHWWVAFLVLTIVGERLELSRILRLTRRTQQWFAIATAIFLGGVLLTTVQLGAGIRLAGVGEVLLAAWLLRYDITRRTVKNTGLPRFIAVCLIAGYVWLGFGGLLGILFGEVRAGLQYELLLHALLLGFVFSMIFGHALIIVPALAKQNVRYHVGFYLPLLLLHVSLLLRVGAGLVSATPMRQWAAVFNVISILSFMGLILFGVLREARPFTSKLKHG